MRRKIAIGLLMVLFAMSLAGCGEIKEKLGIAFPTREYVEGTLEAVYHGAYEKYCFYTEETEESAAAYHTLYVEKESEYMADYLCIEAISSEGKGRLDAVVEKLYEQVRFEVQEPIDKNRDQIVEVVVYPVDFFGAAKSELEATMNEFNQKLAAGEYDELTMEEQKLAYENAVLTVCEKYTDLPESDYQVSANLSIKECEGGYYQISDGFEELDALVISY